MAAHAKAQAAHAATVKRACAQARVSCAKVGMGFAQVRAFGLHGLAREAGAMLAQVKCGCLGGSICSHQSLQKKTQRNTCNLQITC